MPNEKFINAYCKNRIKPTLLRDVKTEALLVFVRTALERYFTQLKEAGFRPVVGSDEDTEYIYSTLHFILQKLQDHVVNVDYILDITHKADQERFFELLYYKEKPLIDYYNALAMTIEKQYNGSKAYIPEFMVICCLSNWILEEEKSVNLYPFLENIDWLELISRFELNAKEFEKNGECNISKIHNISFHVVKKLKEKKFQIKQYKKTKHKK
jgi:hypothetical protein